MRTKLKYIVPSLVVFLLAGIGIVSANPNYFITVPASSTATTTPTFLTSTGQATSTALDAYIPQGRDTTGTNFGLEKNSLIVQDTASSTSSVLGIRFQYSIDDINWADDNYQTPPGTTTQTVLLQQYYSYQWNAAGTATTTKIIMVPTPTRYVRAIFTETGAAAGIWYTWAPSKQQP